jgi:Spy/CpxP family protein refolding chaperone
MCHASRREQRHRHFEDFPFAAVSDWLQSKHFKRSAPPQDWNCDEQAGSFMRHHHHHHDSDRFEGRSAFGVRRPLRFLAHKLDLDEKQITALMRILDELKTERAQAEVDDRRATAEFADAVEGEAFDGGKAGSAGERRVQSAARLREALTRALQEMHAILTPEQRQRLAYLIRSGVLSV